MTALEIIRQLETLDQAEVDRVRDWLNEQVVESPELLAALDKGLADLEVGRVTDYSREAFAEKAAAWIGKSR